MAVVGDIGHWITNNESLLSGLAALVALAGVILSATGWALRHMAVRRRQQVDPAALGGPLAVAARVAAGGPDASANPEATRAEGGEPLVAVLPFDNLSSDGEMQFFSDGVSEEIIQRLSRGATLAVIGRASSFQFRGERKAEAASRLKCSHVLDGSIRRARDRVRVSAHLVDAASSQTVWSDRYDRGLEDIFAIQDEIAENIASALDRAFLHHSTPQIEPAAYDLYLRACPTSFAPDELRANIGLLEVVTARAPHFGEAWGRQAFLRAWLSLYQPYADRPAIAARVKSEAEHALALDPRNADALTGLIFIEPPFGRFVETEDALERLRRAPGSVHGGYLGWVLRTTGRVRESLEEAERAYRLNTLDPISGNLVALARMAAGRLSEAIPVYEELVSRVPDMSFPVASLVRAYAFQKDWASVDRLLELAARRELREFRDGLPFIRAKREPTAENIAAWRSALEAHVAKTGWVDVSRLVYTAHLGLVDLAYGVAGTARLGPAGTSDDIMGPDAYRSSLLFQASMPELRNDPRFVSLCARLGLVEFWLATDKWPDCVAEVSYDFRAECAKARNVPKDRFWP